MRRLLVALATAAVLVVLALPGLAYQGRDVDVLLYASAAARANAEGTFPYVSAWIEKGPIAMGLYQALDSTAGSYHFPGLAVLWLSFALATAWLVAALARAAGSTRGWPAALLFAVSVTTVSGTFNTEIPAATFVAAALLARHRGRLFTAGLLAALAFLCRQNAGAVWAVMVALEALSLARGTARSEALRRAVRVTAGFALPVAATFALFLAAGAWEPFWFCFWSYHTEFYVAATRVDARRLLSAPIDAFRHFLYPTMETAVAGIAGIGIVLAGVRRKHRRASDETAEALVVAALALTVAIVPGFRYFSHYFALPLPLWCALGGVALDRSAVVVRTRANRGSVRAVAAALLVVVLVTATRSAWERPWRPTRYGYQRWIAAGPARWADPIEWPGIDGGSKVVARWIRGRAASGDRLFVWGMRPHLYAYTRLVPATRFVTCTFLTGLVPWERMPPEDTTRWIVPGSWDLLMADLEDERPRFVVDVSEDPLFGDGGYAVATFPRLDRFLREGYAPAATMGESPRYVIWERLNGRSRGS